jgi:acetyl esterase
MEVMGIDYSLSPEAKRGVALEEIAIAWKTINQSRFRIVCGQSSGGNLAASFAESTTDKPDALVLFFPVTDISGKHYPSYDRFAKGYGLELKQMQEYIKAYVPNESERALPAYSVINGNVTAYPKTLVTTMQFDILRDEGRALALKLRESGRLVRYRCMEGAIHGFGGKARAAVQNLTVSEVKRFLEMIRT